jgi:hypothetical protein
VPHYGNLTVRDYSDETSNFRVNFGAVTAVSIAGLLTEWGNLRTAVTNVILGIIGKESLVMDSTVLDNTTPASQNAQVELKWLLSYEGNTSKKKFSVEIPTPNTSKLVPGTDMADLADTDVAALVTAFETVARTPDSDVETVNVLDMRLVGRNI